MHTLQLYSFEGRAPRIDPQAYVHPSAVVIGDVQIGPGCFVGPHATLRGDQGAVLHGCTLMENSLVGINATVLDDAIVGCHSIVGAQSLVKRGARLEGHSLYAGSPALFVDHLSAERIEALQRSAWVYVAKAQAYRQCLVRIRTVEAVAGPRSVTPAAWGWPRGLVATVKRLARRIRPPAPTRAEGSAV